MGHSPKNKTVHFEIPEGHKAQDLVGKLVDVRVEEARTWYLRGPMVGDPEASEGSQAPGMPGRTRHMASWVPLPLVRAHWQTKWPCSLGTDVISVDSMQVYRGMDIGTAKTPMGERRVPLQMVDVSDISKDYSGSRCSSATHACL